MNIQDFHPAFQVVNFVSAGVILWKGLFYVANHMTRKTKFLIRWAWIFMITGAFAVVVAPFFGVMYAPGIVALIQMGVALFVLQDRRLWGVHND